MTDKKKLIAIAIALVITFSLIGLIVWKLASLRAETSQATPQQYTQQPATQKEQNTAPTQLIWQQIENGWRSTSTPPACSDNPLLAAPTDISKVTSILYPGQTRGGNYKPHGGFRFDTAKGNAAQVIAPIDGFVVRGGQYLAEGEIQYTFDVMNNCGIMYRIGHLRNLTSKFQALTTNWPAAVEGDSRTQSVMPPVLVKKGEVFADQVGIIKDSNTFFDFGVYDYRQENEASKSSAYQQAHASDKELSWHAVCWFGLLPSSDNTKLRSLPAGNPTSGKSSDYCK